MKIRRKYLVCCLLLYFGSTNSSPCQNGTARPIKIDWLSHPTQAKEVLEKVKIVEITRSFDRNPLVEFSQEVIQWNDFKVTSMQVELANDTIKIGWLDKASDSRKAVDVHGEWFALYRLEQDVTGSRNPVFRVMTQFGVADLQKKDLLYKTKNLPEDKLFETLEGDLPIFFEFIDDGLQPQAGFAATKYRLDVYQEMFEALALRIQGSRFLRERLASLDIHADHTIWFTAARWRKALVAGGDGDFELKVRTGHMIGGMCELVRVCLKGGGAGWGNLNRPLGVLADTDSDHTEFIRTTVAQLKDALTTTNAVLRNLNISTGDSFEKANRLDKADISAVSLIEMAEFSDVLKRK
jgi:hypothetical protein